jgi:hypothetical protein
MTPARSLQPPQDPVTIWLQRAKDAAKNDLAATIAVRMLTERGRISLANDANTINQYVHGMEWAMVEHELNPSAIPRLVMPSDVTFALVTLAQPRAYGLCRNIQEFCRWSSGPRPHKEPGDMNAIVHLLKDWQYHVTNNVCHAITCRKAKMDMMQARGRYQHCMEIAAAWNTTSHH